MSVLYEIYLGDGGWSVLAWIGTLLLLGMIASFIVGALDSRVPRARKPRTSRKEADHG